MRQYRVAVYRPASSGVISRGRRLVSACRCQCFGLLLTLCCCCCFVRQVIKANDDLTPQHHQFFLYQMLRGLKYIHSGTLAPHSCACCKQKGQSGWTVDAEAQAGLDPGRRPRPSRPCARAQAVPALPELDWVRSCSFSTPLLWRWLVFAQSRLLARPGPCLASQALATFCHHSQGVPP